MIHFRYYQLLVTNIFTKIQKNNTMSMDSSHKYVTKTTESQQELILIQQVNQSFHMSDRHLPISTSFMQVNLSQSQLCNAEQPQCYLRVYKVIMLQYNFQSTPAIANEIVFCWSISVVDSCVAESINLRGFCSKHDG